VEALGVDVEARAAWPQGWDCVDRRLATIDGPAGCGKSTVCHRLAALFDGRAFSSGRIYRAVTWLALKEQIDLEDVDSLLALVAASAIELVETEATIGVKIDGIDPGDVLYSSRVTTQIHHVSDQREIRSALLPLQRSLPSLRPVFAEGRDMGTVVFPDATVKIFLTATIEERALRRQREFSRSLGEELSLAEVTEQVRRRDELDSSRDVSPLKPAEDAQVLDTTDLGIEEVVSSVAERIPEDWSEEGTGSTG